MHDDGGTLARLVASVVLAALPFAWMARNRGARRDRASEGRSDGLLLLGAAVLALFAFFLSGTSLVRRAREARVAAEWEPVRARIERCGVAERRGGGRNGSRSYELCCTVRADGAAEPHALTAGYPPRRAGYDAWLAAHPAGSAIPLRRDPQDPARLGGLDLVAPSTTTARAAADQALRFAVLAAVLLAISRLIVARRRAA